MPSRRHPQILHFVHLNDSDSYISDASFDLYENEPLRLWSGYRNQPRPFPGHIPLPMRGRSCSPLRHRSPSLDPPQYQRHPPSPPQYQARPPDYLHRRIRIRSPLQAPRRGMPRRNLNRDRLWQNPAPEQDGGDNPGTEASSDYDGNDDDAIFCPQIMHPLPPPPRCQRSGSESPPPRYQSRAEPSEHDHQRTTGHPTPTYHVTGQEDGRRGPYYVSHLYNELQVPLSYPQGGGRLWGRLLPWEEQHFPLTFLDADPDTSFGHFVWDEIWGLRSRWEAAWLRGVPFQGCR